MKWYFLANKCTLPRWGSVGASRLAEQRRLTVPWKEANRDSRLKWFRHAMSTSLARNFIFTPNTRNSSRLNIKRWGGTFCWVRPCFRSGKKQQIPETVPTFWNTSLNALSSCSTRWRHAPVFSCCWRPCSPFPFGDPLHFYSRSYLWTPSADLWWRWEGTATEALVNLIKIQL